MTTTQETPVTDIVQTSFPNKVARAQAAAAAAAAAPVQPAGIDLSYLNALPLVTYDYQTLNIVVVGLGGTGSWLAPHTARIAKTLQGRGKKVRLFFIDHDFVEEVNVERQNFCMAEVGYNKARVLALRYGMAWGLDITSQNTPFSFEKARVSSVFEWGSLSVFVGCVDNAHARNFLSLTLGNNPNGKELPRCFWLDCGNSRESGQVLLGASSSADSLSHAFDLAGVCTNLPSPALQDPSLLVARPEELDGANEDSNLLSCEQMALANAQSLMINQRVAAEAADYLLRLLVTGGLKKFQTYIDLPSGTTKSTYITPQNVGKSWLGVEQVVGKKQKKS